MVAPDFDSELKRLDSTLRTIEQVLDPEVMRREVAELQQRASVPDLWDDPASAQKITTRLSVLQGQLEQLESLRARLDDAAVLAELAAVGANVLEVEHERTDTQLHIGEVEVFVVLETRGPDHADEVVAALSRAGYAVTHG